MRLFLSALLLLLPLPALAQSLQFDTTPSAPEQARPAVRPPNGIEWLQNKPMTLFDLGMMELTNAANQLATSVTNVRGAVAEYQSEKGLIAVSFYAATPYTKTGCTDMAKQMRDGLFLQRQDPEKLQRELSSYFISYGPPDVTRPHSIGAELLQITRVTVYMQGGACQMGLLGDEAEQWDETPDAPATPAAVPLPAPSAQAPRR